uniref:Amiloride-sensitive sodium channel n=1 Tax=Acrobeloides nanus TaxID=290746 RepID=A0A914C9D9_9BILA
MSGILLWSYHLKPTLTQVTVVVPNDGLLFPDLTLCNYNLVMKSKISKWNMSSSVVRYVMKAYKQKFLINDLKLAQEHELFLNYSKEFQQINGKPFDFVEFFNSTGFECTDFVKACWWSGTPQNCCADRNLIKEVYSDYGKCFTLTNQHKQWRQSLTGSDHGWEILVDVKNFEAVENINDELLYSEFGVRLFVHDWHKFPILSSYGVSTPTGKKLYAGLELKNVSLLPKTDWGSCESDWNPAVHGNETANLMNWMLENCGCVAITKRISVKLPICSPYELYQCQIKGANLRPKNCNCSVECSRLEYRISTSYSDLLHSSYNSHNLMANKMAKRLHDYAKIVVYFREMSYERHEQHRQMQTADLLSSIAGSMGLFMGMSTVTLLEIFIYLFKSMWGTINTERQRQFVRAMIEEEKRQNVVILEKPPTPPMMNPNEREDSCQKTVSESIEENLVTVQETFIPKCWSSDNQEETRNQANSFDESFRSRKRTLTIVIDNEPRRNSQFPQRKWTNLSRREPHLSQSEGVTPSASRRSSSYDNHTPLLFRQGSIIHVPLANMISTRNSTQLVGRRRESVGPTQRNVADLHVHVNRPRLRRNSSQYVDHLI